MSPKTPILKTVYIRLAAEALFHSFQHKNDFFKLWGWWMVLSWDQRWNLVLSQFSKRISRNTHSVSQCVTIFSILAIVSLFLESHFSIQLLAISDRLGEFARFVYWENLQFYRKSGAAEILQICFKRWKRCYVWSSTKFCPLNLIPGEAGNFSASIFF